MSFSMCFSEKTMRLFTLFWRVKGLGPLRVDARFMQPAQLSGVVNHTHTAGRLSEGEPVRRVVLADASRT